MRESHRIIAEPNATTTILGRYDMDTKNIIEELQLPKTTDFSGNEGGFVRLNTPDELYKTPRCMLFSLRLCCD